MFVIRATRGFVSNFGALGLILVTESPEGSTRHDGQGMCNPALQYATREAADAAIARYRSEPIPGGHPHSELAVEPYTPPPLKKESCVLADADESTIPPGMLAFVREQYGQFVEAHRFRARNWLTAVHTGYVFRLPNASVVLEEGCNLMGVPAWGVSFVGNVTATEAVDGMFCHTSVTVSFMGYNTPVK